MQTDSSFLPPVPSLPPTPVLPQDVPAPPSFESHAEVSGGANDVPAGADNFAFGNDSQESQDVVPVETFTPTETVSPIKRFWLKFGGTGFTISVVFHAFLILFVLFWIVSTHIIPAKETNDISTGAGGGNQGEKNTMNTMRVKPKNARSMVKSPSKLVAKGAASISLPDMPSMTNAFDAGNPLGASSKGAGGGAGGGDGGGIGPGIGGGRNLVTMFGVSGRNAVGLEGALYDIKQSKSGKYHDPGVGGYAAIMRDFFGKGNWDESILEKKYFAAPNKLFLTQVLIPHQSAAAAPKAFNVEDKIKPSRWIAIYHGAVRVPFTGKFRFVGSADDWLMVRWKGELALDSGFGNNCGLWATGDGVIKGKDGKPLPGTTDTYLYGKRTPYMRCGPWFEVREGEVVPIEIALGETPGGVFYAALAFEQQGHKGKLRLFRMTSGDLPQEVIKGDIPHNIDHSGGGFVWKPQKAKLRSR